MRFVNGVMASLLESKVANIEGLKFGGFLFLKGGVRTVECELGSYVRNSVGNL